METTTSKQSVAKKRKEKSSPPPTNGAADVETKGAEIGRLRLENATSESTASTRSRNAILRDWEWRVSSHTLGDGV